jgi:hypothetical protein
LLAEGLYALFGMQGANVPFNERFERATQTFFWSYFIEARRKAINGAIGALKRSLDKDPTNRRACSALSSLEAARGQLRNVIRPDLCANFLAAWRKDLDDWQKFSSGLSSVGSTREAMEFLKLETWIGPDLVPARKAPDEAYERSSPPVSNRRRRSNRPKAGKN